MTSFPSHPSHPSRQDTNRLTTPLGPPPPPLQLSLNPLSTNQGRKIPYAGAEHTLGPTFSEEEDGDDSEWIANKMVHLGLNRDPPLYRPVSLSWDQGFEVILMYRHTLKPDLWLINQLKSKHNTTPKCKLKCKHRCKLRCNTKRG